MPDVDREARIITDRAATLAHAFRQSFGRSPAIGLGEIVAERSRAADVGDPHARDLRHLVRDRGMELDANDDHYRRTARSFVSERYSTGMWLNSANRMPAPIPSEMPRSV